MAKSTQRGRARRWGFFGLALLVLAMLGSWFPSSANIRFHRDERLAIQVIEFPGESQFVQAGWFAADRPGAANRILTVWTEPSRVDWMQSILQLEKKYRARFVQATQIDLATQRITALKRNVNSHPLSLHRGLDGRACYHEKPGRGEVEICSHPAACQKAIPEILFHFPDQEYAAYLEQRGNTKYFVVDDRSENENMLRESLGSFAQLYAWPQLSERGRAILQYGNPGNWAELSELRLSPEEQDDRWPIQAEQFGHSAGDLFPLAAKVSEQGFTQLLAVWETASERAFFQLDLDEELGIHPLGTVPRGLSGYLSMGAPVYAEAEGAEFFAVQARAQLAAPYAVSLDVRLPGGSFTEVALPVELVDFDLGADSWTPSTIVIPFLGPQELSASSIPDQDQDGTDDWRVLVKVDGLGGSILICADLSGATGEILPRKND